MHATHPLRGPDKFKLGVFATPRSGAARNFVNHHRGPPFFCNRVLPPMTQSGPGVV